MKKYEYIQIGIASPEEILSWSHGEVTKHETINYRTLKPEKDGLFCEVIFGPTKDYQCACGKKQKTSEKGKKCEKCGVELTESKVRRERMGHIKLAAPVVHTWFLKNTPSKIAILLDMKTKYIESIVYLTSYIVMDPGRIEGLTKGRILTEQENSDLERKFGRGSFKSLTGAEAIKQLLHELDEHLEEVVAELRTELKGATKQRKEKIIKRLEVAEAFLKSDNKPEWMVMDVIPVIPPDLRPMVQLDGGRFATTDLNDLYRRILNRNNRLKKQIELRAPALMTKNEKRMLQEAVDALIDNGKRNKKVVIEKNRPLKSLSDLLRGKQGRFRQNLLGKRVDFSGRSVIAVGPDLKMYQCGIPREMALILFKPFIINALMKKYAEQSENGQSKISVKKAREMIEEGHPDAMEMCEKVVVEHPVLLNRAPTLHRLGIQAFEPKLVEGKAIRLHPLVCPPFNADFDGDQMAVHLPLSEEAQTEARLLMLASKNILAPKDGKPIVTPSQDMVLGNYYLTIEDEKDSRNGQVFKDTHEVELAYENNLIGLHTRLFIPAKNLDFPLYNYSNKNKTEEEKAILKQLDDKARDGYYLLTTYGKILFNSIFPEGVPFVNEAKLKNIVYGIDEKYLVKKGANLQVELSKWIDEGSALRELKEELKDIADNKARQKEVDKRFESGVVNGKNILPHPFKKKFLETIIAEVFKEFRLAETSKTLDRMKDLGFKYSTLSGITVSAYDINVIPTKYDALKEADKEVAKYDRLYRHGLLTQAERKKNVINLWQTTKGKLEGDIKEDVLNHYIDNHIYLMSDSGARGNIGNFVQLSGMRGLMAKPNGESMDIPIRSCFREGLTMSEFFISSHGSRKGSTDTALKTAESGYLTRRLVDVSQDVTITMNDCGTTKGMKVSELVTDDGTVIAKLKDRINGRFTNKPVFNPATGEEIIGANEYISDEIADRIITAGVKEVWIRTLLTCDCPNGVCVKCYGSDLTTGDIVEKGEVVGIIAAQSIGEPGTQLTMRTFHSGGVAGEEDITQGLPRVQELFEARPPKGKAIISEISGVVESIKPEKDHRFEITVYNKITDERKPYLTDSGKTPIVKEGDKIVAGQKLVAGLVHPKELIRVGSTEEVEQYIVKEVEKVYASQSVGICDKHIEIIVKQMLQKVVVVNEGDTDLLPGSHISKSEIVKIFMDCNKKGIRTPIVKPLLLGITRSSLKSDSFLSAASFQETTRVLTESAIRGKKDRLEGLKENIIIGGLIPAGTGLVDEKSIVLEKRPKEEAASETVEEA